MDKAQENGTRNTVLEESSDNEEKIPSLDVLLKTITDNSSLQPEGDKKNVDSLYKHKGFYEAIGDRDCPLSSLPVLRNELKAGLDAEINALEEIIKLYLDRYQIKIARAEEAIKNEEEKLRALADEVPQLLEEKKIKQKELEAIRQNLFSIRDELAFEKKSLIDKWLTEAEKEIKKILDIKAFVLEDKQKEAKNIFTSNKSNYDKKKIEAEKLLAYYSQRYDEVHQQMTKLGTEGMNPVSARFLKWAGYTAIIAAGWFFSVFTSKTQFSNQDPFQYLFHGLLDFANYTPGNALNRVFQWLGILGLIVIVSFACGGLLHLIKGKKKGDLKRNGFEQELKTQFDVASFYYKGNFKTGNWLHFLLNVVPLLFIIGIIIIFLAFNKDNLGKVGELDSSLAGLAAGSGICIGISAIIYLYIIRVIEPRLNRNNQESSFSRKTNRELFFVLIFFSLCTLGIIIQAVFTDHFFATKEYIIISILEFLSIALLAGFAMGYGLRYLGLIYTSHFLERKVVECTDDVALYSGQDVVTADQSVNEKISSLINDLFGQVQDRGNLLKVALSEKESNKGWVPKFFKWRLFRVKKKRIAPPVEVPEEINVPDGSWILKEWEEKYFADYFTRIETIQMAYKDKQKELSGINDRIELLINKHSGPVYFILKEIELWFTRIDNWKYWIILIYQRRDIQKDNLTKEYIQKEVELMEGFHLGMWYREHKLGPMTEFYKSCAEPV